MEGLENGFVALVRECESVLGPVVLETGFGFGTDGAEGGEHLLETGEVEDLEMLAEGSH